MLDARLRPLIDPALNRLGRSLSSIGIGPNSVTILGMLVGIGAAVAIASSEFSIGLALILLNRLLDGLDGAVARAGGGSDFGGYLDIVADFVFYVGVPVGFGFADPANLPAALVLVALFALTGVSFLAFATLAAKRNLETEAHGKKSFFYNTGIAEGTETIVVFVVMAVFPEFFIEVALVFAALCILTLLQRTIVAWRTFR